MTIQSIGRFGRRWKVQYIALTTVFIPLLFWLWVLFPWPDRVYTHERDDGTFTRVEVTRSYRLLPRREWGFSGRRMEFCGPTWGHYEESRFGFFEMTDVTAMKLVPRVD